MIDNSDTAPEIIRNKYGQGNRNRFNLQRTQSLGVTGSTISETSSTSFDSAGISSGGSAGISAYQSGVDINPVQTTETYSETYTDEQSLVSEITEL